MTIVKKLTASILGLVLLSSAGCDQRPSSYTPANAANSDKGVVAVIDLDKVAKQMGWTDELTKAQGDLDKQLSDALNKYGEQLRTEYSAEEKKITELSSKEDKTKLATLKEKLDGQFRSQFQAAQQQSQQNRVTLVVKYRDTISPVARRVGNSKGFSVIMIKNDALLTFDPKNEITDEVIDELQKVNKGGGPITGASSVPATGTGTGGGSK